VTQREQYDDATSRAAELIARALSELHQTSPSDVHEELKANRSALQDLTSRIDRHLAEEREQHLALGGQLTTLAGSLDRLVSHLQGLSTLMSDLLERLAGSDTGATDTPAVPAPEEPCFQPGGEGLSLTIIGVSGFQALMEIQKALTALDQIAHASVERFQEGDSRLLLALTAPVTASELLSALIRATGQAMTVEDSKPELARLRVRAVPAG